MKTRKNSRIDIATSFVHASQFAIGVQPEPGLGEDSELASANTVSGQTSLTFSFFPATLK